MAAKDEPKVLLLRCLLNELGSIIFFKDVFFPCDTSRLAADVMLRWLSRGRDILVAAWCVGAARYLCLSAWLD